MVFQRVSHFVFSAGLAASIGLTGCNGHRGAECDSCTQSVAPYEMAPIPREESYRPVEEYPVPYNDNDFPHMPDQSPPAAPPANEPAPPPTPDSGGPDLNQSARSLNLGGHRDWGHTPVTEPVESQQKLIPGNMEPRKLLKKVEPIGDEIRGFFERVGEEAMEMKETLSPKRSGAKRPHRHYHHPSSKAPRLRPVPPLTAPNQPASLRKADPAFRSSENRESESRSILKPTQHARPVSEFDSSNGELVTLDRPEFPRRRRSVASGEHYPGMEEKQEASASSSASPLRTALKDNSRPRTSAGSERGLEHRPRESPSGSQNGEFGLRAPSPRMSQNPTEKNRTPPLFEKAEEASPLRPVPTSSLERQKNKQSRGSSVPTFDLSSDPTEATTKKNHEHSSNSAGNETGPQLFGP